MGRAEGNGKERRTPSPRAHMPVSGSADPPRPERRPSPVPEWVTILVVDDEAPIRQVLVDLLGNLGYHTVEAESAERALDLLNVKLLLDQLERAEKIITTLALTIEARDYYTSGHCDRLARYAVAIGQALGVDQNMLRALRLGGYLHDLGKIAVRDH